MPGEGPIARIAAGTYHTCALMKTGNIFCWGQGAYRQLGGDYGAQHVARKVDAVTDAIGLDCGHRFSCALRPGGAVWCWGDDLHGESGTATTQPCGDATIDSVCIATPQPVVGLESGIVELALGAYHACVRRGDGAVICWGDNSAGQVGAQVAGDVRDPHVVDGVVAKRLVAGDSHTCALVGSPGKVFCWGSNQNGQLGRDPLATAVSTPAEVTGLSDAVDIAGGGEHTCAIRAGGAVVCWGYDYLGQLGNGSTRPTRATSFQSVVGLGGAVEVSAGRYHSCVRKGDGTVSCWGENAKGELGDGDVANQTSPVNATGIQGATLMTTGWWHTCVAFADGHMKCWGDDLGAELGDNRVTNDPTPTAVDVQGLP
jgi:alpha-tubulin suppressor-like RCC1 family protein